MEAYYDASLTASILVKEVMKELKIDVSPSDCCKNNLDKKIFKQCKRIIEKEYSDKSYQDLLKLYISSYFIQDSIDEDGIIYEDISGNGIDSEYDNYFDENINLAS